MKTKTLLKTTGLTILMMLLTLITNAQIPIQGLHTDHEGTASWGADGTGPEPAGIGHEHPFGWDNAPYYGASRDYDDIDPDPDAALAHFLDDINGFPLFEQALIDNGFSPAQVKIKNGLMSLKDDVEGEDWFTMNNQHHFNYYDAIFTIELNGEPMISGYINYGLFSYNQSVNNSWQLETNFTKPYDVSENSSLAVKEVTIAFLADMDGEELRIKYENLQSTGISFNGNGRDGVFFEIVSGSLEKGLPDLPSIGLATDHEGIACWNADGTGPEPAASGHTFWYGGTEWWITYYFASRDYDDIDPDPNAGLGHFIDIGTGFPNLEVQLAYRGFTIEQLTSKTDIATLGNDVEGEDWGMNGNIHWYHTYGNTITFEIANEPILECVTDTNYSFWDMDDPYGNWWSHTGYVTVTDISANASSDAQHVAASFLKDLGGHTIKFFSEGNDAPGTIETNGRIGVIHEILNGGIEAKLPTGTHIWENEIKDTLFLDQSPYVFMDYCEIPDGEILVIEPGVVVKFNTTERFDINGCILAEGEEQLPILFTAYDYNVRWGGMYWSETPATNDTSKLEHCIFEYAYAYGTEFGYNCGGAIGIHMVEKIKISHSIFRYNSADKFTANNPAGGAIFVNASSIHISHCIFHDNESSWGGALVLGTNSSSIVDNCLFYNNKSTYIGGGGGAVLVWTDCTPHFVNCTFADNHAVDAGGAVELEFGGESTFTNCIFWGNTANIGANQISVLEFYPTPSLNVYYSDVEDGLNGITPGFTGEYIENLEVDPEFMGQGEEFPYGISEGSPCINIGTLDPLYLPADWYCPAYCLCGNTRVYGNAIDLGCYESLLTTYDEFENQGSFSVNVFPNPINSNPVVEFYLINKGPVQISILDIHGKVITDIISDQQRGKNQVTLYAENISSGIYFCLLKTNDGIQSTKLIKL